jgi:hypothetical protein
LCLTLCCYLRGLSSYSVRTFCLLKICYLKETKNLKKKLIEMNELQFQTVT